MPKCKVLTKPLSDLVASDTFIDTHPSCSLTPEAVGSIKGSPCSLILALIYLDLLKELDPQYVRRVPPSELLLVAMVSFSANEQQRNRTFSASITFCFPRIADFDSDIYPSILIDLSPQMVSTKFYSGYDEDVYITEWAEYGNLAVERLKALEIEFLDAMDWKIYVSNETFFKKLKQIEYALAERETRARGGWLTYTELCTLMPSIDAIRKALSYTALLAVSYTAGVIALAGAFFVASHVPGSYLCNRAQSQTAAESVATSVLNETNTPTAMETDSVTKSECRPGGGACSGNYSDLTELEERLILDGVAWQPVSSADEDGKRIHLNGGTDYWTILEGSAVNSDDPYGQDEIDKAAVDELVERLGHHGAIRKIKENETTTHVNYEWQPIQSNHHDLSLLSYLWLKFL